MHSPQKYPISVTSCIASRFEQEAGGLDDSGLVNELSLLAGNLNAANYRFVVLIAECDRRRIWAQHGALSCAYWLSYICGLSLHAGRERLRVGHALAGLPRISEAFAAGEISYSKVRAVTRVAVPENEKYLLSICRHGTAKHVETLVAGYRQALATAEKERSVRQQDARRLSYSIDEDGMVVIKCRLTPEVGARVVKAIEAAIDDAEADYRLDGSPGCDNASKDDFAPLPSASSPQPDGTYKHSCNHGEPIVEVVSKKRADAIARLADAYLDGGSPHRVPSDRYQITVHVDGEVLVDSSNPGRAEIEQGAALAGESVRRMACNGSLVALTTVLDKNGKASLDVGRKTRAISPTMKRALNARDRGCRFPGCSATRYVEAHHIHHWANGGETSLDNLVSLCHHHHHLVHEGGYSVERKAGGELVFRRPCGDVLPQEPPSVFANGYLASQNRVREIHIDHRTGRGRWDGVRMDKHLATQVLFQRTRPDLVWEPGQRFWRPPPA